MKTKLLKLIKSEIIELKTQGKELNLMVSGGVDSAVLLATMIDMDLVPDRLITVRLPYGEAHDEYDYALELVIRFGLLDKLITIELDDSKFFDVMKEAVKAIGRPIPHYNIFPLYVAFEQLSKEGVTDVVVGDGPDESMCGYTRHLIMNYFYEAYQREEFKHYEGMLKTILEDETGILQYSRLIGKDVLEVAKLWIRSRSIVDNMCRIDMMLMRPDMMDMSHSLAKHFGITIHAPYEKKTVDEFMFNLPKKLKINGPFGKFLLRELGEELGVPDRIIWRTHKIGGPVVPVNKIAGWDWLDPYDKSEYLKLQENILNDN